MCGHAQSDVAAVQLQMLAQEMNDMMKRMIQPAFPYAGITFLPLRPVKLNF